MFADISFFLSVDSASASLSSELSAASSSAAAAGGRPTRGGNNAASSASASASATAEGFAPATAVPVIGAAIGGGLLAVLGLL